MGLKEIKQFPLMRTLAYTLLFLLLATLQTSVLARHGIFGVVPDVILSAVLAVGYREGALPAGIAGLCAGLLIEAAGGTGLCLYPLLYLTAGFFCGAYFASNARRNLLTFLVTAALCLLGRSVVLLVKAVFTYGAEAFPLGQVLLRVLLPEVLLSLVLALPIFALSAGIHALTRKLR